MNEFWNVSVTGAGTNANLGRKSEGSYFSNTVQKMSIKTSNYKNIQLQDIKVVVCKVAQTVIGEDKKKDWQF